MTSVPSDFEKQFTSRRNVPSRADELEDLLNAVQELIIPFIRCADEDAVIKSTGLPRPGAIRTALVEPHNPEELSELFSLVLPENEGHDSRAFSSLPRKPSNTVSIPGTRDLWTSYPPLRMPLAYTSIMLLQPLQLSKKTTARRLALLFGLDGPHAGSISTPGGSASNMTALVVARHTLYPETKICGNTHKFAIFTSSQSHYSFEKSARILGLGSQAIKAVGVDDKGRMMVAELVKSIQLSISEGERPLFVNATADTTVLGAFDPIPEISQVCKSYGLWLHVDGSWGGSVIFSKKHRAKLAGTHLANSLAINPHKMLSVPMTCSFLLSAVLKQFHNANTLPTSYLFHENDDEAGHADGAKDSDGEVNSDFWDLADLSLQCGRRGDSFKLAVSWIYYGASGFERQIDGAFSVAAYLASVVADNKHLILVRDNPPPALQVAFYLASQGRLALAQETSALTRQVARKLLLRGFMVDFMPGDQGLMFRIVINSQTLPTTVDGLIRAIVEESVNAIDMRV